MAKKRSDTDEVQIRWHQFINGVKEDPALQSFFQRHRGVGEEPRTLFEAIGEDLANSREEIREQAFWILVAGMPELADILHERETRQPGWRSGAGQGQQVIDRGMDIVSYLYGKLVKEHEFKTKERKDPRPYVRTAARNWMTDAWRKESRLVSLDEPLSNEGMTLGSSLAASLPDPTSVEDEVVNELYYEHGLQQIRTWSFLQDEELGWFAETYVAKHPLDFVAEQFDIPAKEADRVRKQKSRARQKALERLESVFMWYLHNYTMFNDGMYSYSFGLTTTAATGELPYEDFPNEVLDSWLMEWIRRAVNPRLAVSPGLLNEGAIYEDLWVVVQSLTHRFDGRPGNMFFLTMKESIHRRWAREWWSGYRDKSVCPFRHLISHSLYREYREHYPKPLKTSTLSIPILEQAINEVIKVGGTPMILSDPVHAYF